MQNLSKGVNLSFVGAGVLAWVLLRELFALAFDPLGWNRLDWIIPVSDIAGIILGVVLFIVLLRSEKANIFLTEVFGELSKVTWPNRKETLLSTGVVSIMLGIATLAILFFDSLWAWVAAKLLY